MVKSKTCGSRPSKNNPNVYSRAELNKLALKKGLTSSDIKKLKKRELCEKLKIAWVATMKSKSMKKSSKAPSKKILYLESRGCNVSKSKAHPDAYTKDELVKLAIRKLGYSESVAKKKTKDELCADLSKVHITPPKKKESAPKKTSKPASPSSKTKLHSYQQQIIDYLLKDKNRGAIAAFSTGSGKTITAIALIEKLFEKDSSYNVIILTPVKQNFEKDMIKYGLSDKIMKKVQIMTADKFNRAYPQGDVKCNSKTILIIDEAHNLKTYVERTKEGVFKNWEGSISKGKKKYTSTIAALRCSSKVHKVLLLTATPVFNNEYDVVNLVTMVKGEDGGKPMGKAAFKHLLNDDAKFNDFFSCVFLFYETKHNNADFPSKEEHNIHIEMTKHIFEKYKKIYNKEKLSFAGVSDSPVFYSNVRTASNSLLDPTGKDLQKTFPLKCIWVLNDILKDKKQKSVIYSSYLKSGVELLQKALDQYKIPYLEITGDVNEKIRKERVNEFNAGSGPNILFITEAGCEGLDLKGVRKIYIYESGWNRKSELQIIGRGVRYKSHAHLPEDQRHVDIYHLLLVPPTIDPETGAKHDILSADQVLKKLTIEKEERLEKFEERLKSISIGNKNCD